MKTNTHSMAQIVMPDPTTNYDEVYVEDIEHRTAWYFIEPLMKCTFLLLNTQDTARFHLVNGFGNSLVDTVESAWNDLQAGKQDISSMIYVLNQTIEALRTVEAKGKEDQR